MRVNQEILTAQVEKYSEQMNRLAQSDNLVRHLYHENETLVRALRALEKSIRSSKSGDSDSESGSESRDCLDFLQEMFGSSEASSETASSLEDESQTS